MPRISPRCCELSHTVGLSPVELNDKGPRRSSCHPNAVLSQAAGDATLSLPMNNCILSPLLKPCEIASKRTSSAFDVGEKILIKAGIYRSTMFKGQPSIGDGKKTGRIARLKWAMWVFYSAKAFSDS